MTTPENDRVEAHVGDTGATAGSAGVRRRTSAAVGGLAVLLVTGVVLAGVAVGGSSASPPATAVAATSTPDTGEAAATVAPASAPATAPAATTDQNTGKVVPPAMSTGQYDTTRIELTALAARLPAHLTLTAPATWARDAARDDDVASCPHIVDRLAADLGARWTYSFGKLPAGPFGCSWTPVPWVPDVSRFFVAIGYETGTVAGLMRGMDSCAGGVEAPHVDVPRVGRGALLYGCDDANGPGDDLAVPDAGGTGVFFLHATGGAQQSPGQVADALLAVVDGAARAYG